MVSIGIQPALLQEGGVAFELSTEAGKRDQQVAANVTLVESADGALAPVTKTERYLTVAHPNKQQMCYICVLLHKDTS